VSNSTIYLIGGKGTIAYFNGKTWKEIESGTDADLKDIWGTPDGREIWVCGWDWSGRCTILDINFNSAKIIWDSQVLKNSFVFHDYINSLWANGNGEFMLAGGAVYHYSLIDKNIIRNEWIRHKNGRYVFDPGNFTYRIRGSGKNNIVIAGDGAMIWHYNGKSWHKYEELWNQDNRLYGLAVTDNLIIAAGTTFEGFTEKAFLLIGRR
jgi:hypothetical protein